MRTSFNTGRPIASLQGLDSAGRVIYMGSFSKVMFPALRLGYLILPPDLVDAFVSARRLADYHSPTIEQAVLADFIDNGHFGRHIRRMRNIYAERQHVLIDAAQRHLAGLIDVRPAQSGIESVFRRRRRGNVQRWEADDAQERSARARSVRASRRASSRNRNRSRA